MSNHRDDLDGEHKAPHWPNPLIPCASGTRELGSDFIRSGAVPCTGERVDFDRTPQQYESLIYGGITNKAIHSPTAIAVARHSFKDHEIRELVNQLKHEADMHHPHPLRRDVISRVVHEFLRGEFK